MKYVNELVFKTVKWTCIIGLLCVLFTNIWYLIEYLTNLTKQILLYERLIDELQTNVKELTDKMVTIEKCETNKQTNVKELTDKMVTIEKGETNKQTNVKELTDNMDTNKKIYDRMDEYKLNEHVNESTSSIQITFIQITFNHGGYCIAFGESYGEYISNSSYEQFINRMSKVIKFIKCFKIKHAVFRLRDDPNGIITQCGLLDSVMKVMTKGKVEIDCTSDMYDYIMKYTNSTIDTIVCHEVQSDYINIRYRYRIRKFCLEKNIKFTDP